MATIIQIKRSSGTSAPSTLKLGELAYTYGTGTQGNLGDRLFVGEGGVDGEGNANNISVIGGQYFTDQLDHVQGTLTASSAVLVDANKAIDEFIIGNSSLGILEANFLKKVAINVGERQTGRLHGNNVLFTGSNKSQIIEAIKKATDHSFQTKIDKENSNIYGNGNMVKKSIKFISKNINRNDLLEKHITY